MFIIGLHKEEDVKNEIAYIDNCYSHFKDDSSKYKKLLGYTARLVLQIEQMQRKTIEEINKIESLQKRIKDAQFELKVNLNGCENCGEFIERGFQDICLGCRDRD